MNRLCLLILLLVPAACSTTNYNNIKAKNPDGSFNMVVEIPSGTNQKWEVKKSGKLKWDKKKGEVRFVDYVAYPGNYGMIPGTKAGDGDPLDVIVIGPARDRGKIVKIRVIGVLKAIDGGERDDKLIAVLDSSELDDRERRLTRLHQVASLGDLDQKYRGAKDIIRLFFENYKGLDKNGKSKMKVLGFADLAETQKRFPDLYQ